MDSETYAYLLSTYGPYLTLEHLAEVLHTSPAALRRRIARGEDPLITGLARARRRIGRRIFFDARRVAAEIEGGSESDECAARSTDRRREGIR